MNYACVLEIFQDINLKVVFNKLKDDVQIEKIFLFTSKTSFVEITLDKDALEEIKYLIQDEIDSIPYGDSTVRVLIDNPN
jgi:hypothetical protein